MQIKQKPYNLFLAAAAIFLLASLIPLNQNSTFDLYFHDTYFIIAHTHVFWVLAIIALFMWVVYFLSKSRLFSKTLTWIHVIVTLITLGLFTLSLFDVNKIFNYKPRRYYEYDHWNTFISNGDYNYIIASIVMVLLLGQLIFIINLIAGIFKRKFAQSNPAP